MAVKLGDLLVKVGYISEDDITETLSAQFGVPSINLSHFEIDPAVLKLVAADVARKYNILPVNKTGATITIAMADPVRRSVDQPLALRDRSGGPQARRGRRRA